ncbi:hypothetical protein BV25DRAFT_840188 [Artomyces pyxidatus]|uniref:Uncharacterized protein n=1 Tax=Artomyces pyxidatus TaxID=48021 RepID=A0ACB8TGV9_9AGAM|nr:hypothetical protein BV25DRAFT_840188 [Artomyces pyxidatus]
MILESQSDRDEERRTLDAELHILTQRIGAINRRRNAIAPISFLPDEILSQIILEHAFAMDIFSDKWFSTLLVCQRWQQITLRHAQLWSYIRHSTAGRDFRASVQRSGQFPLTCVFAPSGDRNEAAVYLQVLRENHAHRVRSLTLTENALFPVAFDQGVTQFPSLEHLGIKSFYTAVTLTDSFFQDVTPGLRSLSCHNIAILGWDSLSNLTNLSLQQSIHDAVPSPSFEQLVALLGRSPRLSRLHLHNYLPEIIPTLDITINLSHLERVRLLGRHQAIHIFFSCLVLPPTTSIDLSSVDIYDGPDMSALLVPIRRHLLRLGAPVLRSMTITGMTHDFLSVAADTAPFSGEPWDADFEPHVRLAVFPDTQHAARRVLAKILDALPLESVHILSTMQTARDPSHVTWRTVFQHIPQLKEVFIPVTASTLTVLEGLLDAISRGPRGLCGARRRRAAQGLYWPLRLRLVAFGHQRYWPDPDAAKHCFCKLEQLLAAYKDMDAPSKPANMLWPTVEVTSASVWSSLTHELRERLAAVVQQLVIDGELSKLLSPN